MFILKNTMNRNLILILFGISGMTALIYEIIWIRPLSLVFGSTIYAVSTIVASFILGLAIGSWLAGRFADRLKNPLQYFAFAQIGVGFYGILLLPVFGALPSIYLGLYQATYPNQTIFILAQILMAMAMITIPATLMGTTLPFMMKTYSKESSFIGKDVGRLDASNSLGAFFGTLAAGFLFIPILGIHQSILVTATINIGLGTIILASKKYTNIKYLGLIIVFLVPLLFLYPSYDVELLAGNLFVDVSPDYTMDDYENKLERQDVLFYKESLYQNVMVTSFESGDRLRLNGKVQCSTTADTVDGLIRMGFYPFDLFQYNYGTPKNALNIGLGCGITSKSLSEHIKTTTIEIDPVVVEANKFFYDTIDHELIIDDARNWLLKNEKKFDLIVTEPSEPWHGNGMLYTKEFFELMADNVSENGLVSQWIPAWELVDEDMMIIYNTFHSVFPYVYVYAMESNSFAQLIFIGSQKELNMPEHELYLFNQDDVNDINTELNTDDKPLIEFSTAYNLYSPPSDTTIYFPFKDEFLSDKFNQ